MSADFTITAHDLASSVLDGVAGNADRMSNTVGNSISRLGSAVGGELGEILSKVGEGFNMIGEESSGMAGKVAAAGAVVTGLSVAFQAMGSADAQAEQQLSAAINATGDDIEAYKEHIEATVGAMEDYGHKSSDTQQALAHLTESTHDTSKALDLMQLTADLAAAKGESLAAAAVQVGKAYEGNQKAFAEYGITIEKNADGTKNIDKAMQELSVTLNGQAHAAVDSFGGQLKVLGVHIEDTASSFANRFGPVITGVAATVTAVATAVEAFGGKAKVAADASTALSAAMEADAAATATATDATVAFDAAADANPVGVIIMAIAALVAIIILLAKNWDTVKDGFMTGIDAIGGAFKWLWNMISDVAQYIASIAQAIGSVFSGISSSLSNMGSWFSSLPAFAEGGVVTRPTVALVGEAGPEAVIPLNGSGIGALGGGSGSGSPGITVNISGAIGNEQYLARTVTNALKTVRARGGGFYV